jgi:hypothetical protein
MTQNPNQDPYSGYGTPQNPYGAPPPQDPYGTPPPQNPYGGYQPQQGPYGVPPPQNPYGAPPYDRPPEYGYGPPQQNPYGAPPGYGAPSPPLGYAPPVQSAPLPLGEAIRQLPRQYIKIFTKPSANTFAEEIGKASWDIVWVQLLAEALLGILIGFIVFGITLPATLAGNQATAAMAASIGALTVGLSLSFIILIPLFFFIGAGIQYGIARMFGGQGTFLAHSYGLLLIGIPTSILSIVGIIPILGSLVSLALGVYNIVLQAFMIMAVHKMSGGRATLVVLFPVIVILLLSCVLFFIVLAAVSHTSPQ